MIPAGSLGILEGQLLVLGEKAAFFLDGLHGLSYPGMNGHCRDLGSSCPGWEGRRRRWDFGKSWWLRNAEGEGWGKARMGSAAAKRKPQVPLLKNSQNITRERQECSDRTPKSNIRPWCPSHSSPSLISLENPFLQPSSSPREGIQASRGGSRRAPAPLSQSRLGRFSFPFAPFS